MPDAIIQLPSIADTTGPKVDSTQLTVGANTVQRERMNITSPTVAGALADVFNADPVGSEYGLLVRNINNDDRQLFELMVLNLQALQFSNIYATESAKGAQYVFQEIR